MAEFKFFCPQCGQHIQCDTSYAGQQINCPVCQQGIAVPQPPRAATAVSPPVAVQSRALRNVLVAVAAMVVLAGLGVGGWYGYSKFKFHKFPPGLVALWSGDDNGKDSVGGNNATLTDITFVKGKTGQAFSFNGSTSYLKVPASSNLNVGLSSGFTIEGWINPASTAARLPIVEWNNDSGSVVSIGVHFWLSVGSIGNLSMGSLQGNIVDTTGGFHSFASAPGIVAANQFQHVALTYDKGSGTGTIYLNGAVVVQQNLGVFTPQMTYNLYLGRRPLTSGTAWAFSGKIDEVAIYNRALSADEIQEIYTQQK